MSKRDVIEIADPTQLSYGDFALATSMEVQGLAARPDGTWKKIWGR